MPRLAPDSLRNDLADACLRFGRNSPGDVVIEESYIPFVPAGWNGVLVLGEAQNHSERNSAYLNWLAPRTQAERVRRLELTPSASPGEIGVQPWDDGSLKLAVDAALAVDPSRCAVGNAVFWSQRDGGGANRSPESSLQADSARLWALLLAILTPRVVVAAGRIADEVVQSATMTSGASPTIHRWPHSSQRLYTPIASSIDEVLLLRRFPEVERGVVAHPEWLIRRRRNAILYACLACTSTSPGTAE